MESRSRMSFLSRGQINEKQKQAQKGIEHKA